MTFFSTRPWARWTVPAVAASMIAAGTVAATVAATASTPLPPRTAAQLLVDLQEAQLAGLSGTVVQTSNLGIPDFPGAPSNSGIDGASSDLTSLVAGTHTLRVWYGGDQQVRVALLGSLGESDIIRNGKDAWIWSSKVKTATHLPAAATGKPDHGTGTGAALTPSDAAAKALAALDPSTAVTTAGSATVAGRAAYELVLTPRAGTTLVKSVRINIDAVTHLPLRVAVYSTKVADPAFEVGFTQVDFAMPEARQFAFTPPPGTTVTTKSIPNVGQLPNMGGSSLLEQALMPTVTGTAWGSVLVGKLPAPSTSDAPATAGAPSSTQDPSAVPTESEGAQRGGEGRHGGAAGGADQLQAMLAVLPKVSGSWGSGRLFAGTLVSMVHADDGRIAIGAVAPEALYAALAAK